MSDDSEDTKKPQPFNLFGPRFPGGVMEPSIFGSTGYVRVLPPVEFNKVVERKGKTYFYVQGARYGPGQERPDLFGLQAAEGAFIANVNKALRLGRLPQTRRSKSKRKDDRDAQIIKEFDGMSMPRRNRASVIAKELGISIAHARKVIAKQRPKK